MPIPTIVSLKSGGLILGIVVSAAGLNMSVLQLNEATEPSEQSALAPVSAAPEEVDVTLPASATAAQVVASTVTATPLQITSAQAQPSTSATSSTASTPTTSTTPPPSLASPHATPPSTQYLTYAFDGIAEIVIALHDGERMEFWSVVPEPGWSFNVETQTDARIKIEFGFGHDDEDRDGYEDDGYEDDDDYDEHDEDEDEAEFELKLVDGQIRVKTER
jgi:hypothetical protein